MLLSLCRHVAKRLQQLLPVGHLLTERKPELTPLLAPLRVCNRICPRVGIATVHMVLFGTRIAVCVPDCGVAPQNGEP